MESGKQRVFWALCTALMSGVYLYPLFLFVRGWSMEMRAYALYGQSVPRAAYLYASVFFLLPCAARLVSALFFLRGSRHARLYLFVLVCVDVLFFSGVTDADNTLTPAYLLAAAALLSAYYAAGFLRVYRSIKTP